MRGEGKRRLLLAAALLMAVLFVLLARPAQPAETAPQGETIETYSSEKLAFSRDGKHIYGKLFLPRGEKPFPLVVLAHGFNGNADKVEPYARAYAESGIAACVFDFIGGGEGSRSDGSIREMSVLTEAEDLKTVLDSLRTRPELDQGQVFLLGRSQGGFVATCVACERPEQIRAMVLFFPGYSLQDDAWARTPDPDKIPETMTLMGATIGRIYNEDAMSFDIYDRMGDYPGDVLILHGTADDIVPIAYAERAVSAFPSAELVRFEGAGHGFYGEDDSRATELAVGFVKARLKELRSADEEAAA